MKNVDKEERRKYERVPFVEDILIDGSRMSTCMDISEGGLYTSTMQFYEHNSVIDVTIPFKAEKLTVKAQVRYCQPGIGMGMMFIDLNELQRAKITELIEDIRKKSDRSVKAGKDVLVVEDNNKSRQAIKGALFKEGFRVIEASNGIEALKSITEQHIDLIILDLHMQGMDGLKVLSFLKTDLKWKELPVIICSAYDTQDVRDEVINAGADEFISKRGTSPARLVQSAKAVLLQRHKTLQG